VREPGGNRVVLKSRTPQREFSLWRIIHSTDSQSPASVYCGNDLAPPKPPPEKDTPPRIRRLSRKGHAGGEPAAATENPDAAACFYPHGFPNNCRERNEEPEPDRSVYLTFGTS
jgi:hypothetical protein